MEKYKIIINVLKAENLAGYTFTPKSEVPFRVVIKGIHPSTDLKSKNRSSTLDIKVRRINYCLYIFSP